jgi:hypothetical protein
MHENLAHFFVKKEMGLFFLLIYKYGLYIKYLHLLSLTSMK